MVTQLKNYQGMKGRMYHFLKYAHSFQEETLNLLSYKNLKKLATEYGFNGKSTEGAIGNIY